MEVGERREVPAPLVEQDHVRDQPDEVDEDPGRAAAGDAEDDGDQGEEEGAPGLGAAQRVGGDAHRNSYRDTI